MLEKIAWRKFRMSAQIMRSAYGTAVRGQALRNFKLSHYPKRDGRTLGVECGREFIKFFRLF